MKTQTLVIIGFFVSTLANSESIYKCTKSDNSIILMDRECPTNTKSTLIHQETEQEIKNKLEEQKIWTIKHLIAGNQNDAAKEYALKNNLADAYYQQLSLYTSQQAAEKRQDEALAKEQQTAIAQQQLALQREQLAIQKSQPEQQQSNHYYNNYPYYGYGNAYRSSPYVGTTYPFKPASPQISSGGMNPPMSSFNQTNQTQSAPISSFSFRSGKR